MNPRLRTLLFAVAAAVIGAGLLRAAAALPAFGSQLTTYARGMNARAPRERRTPNVPTAITFDYRGFDTLGEEFILFAAVVGVTRVLKHGREEAEHTREDESAEREVPPDPSAAVRALARVLGAGTLLLGVNVVAHGHLTPGGGFQGGVVLSSAALLAYLGFGARAFRRMTPDAPTDVAEALGAAGYALIGLGGLVAGGAFLANVLPLGTFGEFASTGTILVLNTAVGCEVAAGFVMLYAQFLDAARTEPSRRPG